MEKLIIITLLCLSCSGNGITLNNSEKSLISGVATQQVQHTNKLENLDKDYFEGKWKLIDVELHNPYTKEQVSISIKKKGLIRRIRNKTKFNVLRDDPRYFRSVPDLGKIELSISARKKISDDELFAIFQRNLTLATTLHENQKDYVFQHVSVTEYCKKGEFEPLINKKYDFVNISSLDDSLKKIFNEINNGNFDAIHSNDYKIKHLFNFELIKLNHHLTSKFYLSTFDAEIFYGDRRRDSYKIFPVMLGFSDNKKETNFITEISEDKCTLFLETFINEENDPRVKVKYIFSKVLNKKEQEAKQKAKKEAQARIKKENEAKQKIEKEAQAKIKKENEAKQKTEKEAQAKIKKENEAKQKTEKEAQAKIKKENEAKQKAEKEAQAKIKKENEAKQKTEKEAQAKIKKENEAKQKAEKEAQAKIKKENEAKQKAEKEAQAKIKKENEAKQKAEKEAQAKIKKENEAKQKAEKEAQAKIKKENEAKQKAEKEAQAKIKKENKAKQKAEKEAAKQKVKKTQQAK